MRQQQSQSWKEHIQQTGKSPRLYPTEWVVRTMAGGNYPNMKLDRNSYRDARILDLSCGDGRNIGLLQDLGFSVCASEINDDIVNELRAKQSQMGWTAEFSCARNGALPYEGNHFQFILACHSCYYLDPETDFDSVLRDIARCIKPGGHFIASIPDTANYLFRDSIAVDDDSVIVTQDPFGLRINQRLAIARNENHLRSMLSPHFHDVSIGHLADDYFGTLVSAYIFVAKKTTFPDD